MCRFSLLDYLFSVQNRAPEGWNHDHESFLWSLSHAPSTPHFTCHSLHLTPHRSSSLLESPFHLFVALKLGFSFLHWEKWERVAGLCGKWKEHRGWKVLKSCWTSLFSPEIFLCFIPIELLQFRNLYSIYYKTLTPWKESYDQPRQHINYQRHILSTKVHLVKAMVFPVVMYGCEI